MDTPESPDATLARDVVVVRRNPWILGLAATPLLAALMAVVAAIAVRPSFFAGVFHPGILGLVALLFAWRRNWRPITERRALRIDAEALTLGEDRIPRASIKSALVLPGFPPKVLVRRRWALPIEIQVESTAEARDVLRALGFDVSQSVATFRTASRAVAKQRYVAGVAAGFVATGAVFGAVAARARVGPGTGALAGLGLILAIISMMVVLLAPTKLSVGADGLVLRWLGTSRFIGLGEITQVTRYERGFGRSRQVGLTIVLRSGEEVIVPVGQASWETQEVALIEERIREALEGFRSGGAAADAASLRRGGRAVSDWIAALRAIGSGANADMRTAPLPRERLFRIVESPTAGASERAAAAVALGGELDEEARQRLRIAAEAIAAPKLRIAVEAAAGGGEAAEIEAALAEVEEESDRAAS